jgi:hypothetical protein
LPYVAGFVSCATILTATSILNIDNLPGKLTELASASANLATIIGNCTGCISATRNSLASLNKDVNVFSFADEPVALTINLFSSAGAFGLGLLFQDSAKVRDEVRAENAVSKAEVRAENAVSWAEVRAENAVSKAENLEILLNVVLSQRNVDGGIIKGIQEAIAKARNQSKGTAQVRMEYCGQCPM